MISLLLSLLPFHWPDVTIHSLFHLLSVIDFTLRCDILLFCLGPTNVTLPTLPSTFVDLAQLPFDLPVVTLRYCWLLLLIYPRYFRYCFIFVGICSCSAFLSCYDIYLSTQVPCYQHSHSPVRSVIVCSRFWLYFDGLPFLHSLFHRCTTMIFWCILLVWHYYVDHYRRCLPDVTTTIILTLPPNDVPTLPAWLPFILTFCYCYQIVDCCCALLLRLWTLPVLPYIASCLVDLRDFWRVRSSFRWFVVVTLWLIHCSDCDGR